MATTHHRHGRFTDFTHKMKYWVQHDTKCCLSWTIWYHRIHMGSEELMDAKKQKVAWQYYNCSCLELERNEDMHVSVCRECENISHEDHFKQLFKKLYNITIELPSISAEKIFQITWTRARRQVANIETGTAMSIIVARHFHTETIENKKTNVTMAICLRHLNLYICALIIVGKAENYPAHLWIIWIKQIEWL